MKLVTIIGARPQFIKAAPVCRAIKDHNQTAHDLRSTVQEILVHTGQHYDDNMSNDFFKELDIPRPVYNLEVSNMSHGAMTGRMLEKIEAVLVSERPDWALVYGDTNSTLAGALAAAKLHIPIAHVEAGLRSFNMRMPEEINRTITDRVSSLLFCPTEAAMENLINEGIRTGAYKVGDVMYDVMRHYRHKAMEEKSLSTWGLKEGEYVLSTIHRPENTDDPSRLIEILDALREISSTIPVVLPLHPRTKNMIAMINKKELLVGLHITEPLPYLDMIRLEMSARAIITDSGGVQKEAFFHKVPCLTLREETEWVETVQTGWNHLCGANKKRILDAWQGLKSKHPQKDSAPYGDGNAAALIIGKLLSES